MTTTTAHDQQVEILKLQLEIEQAKKATPATTKKEISLLPVYIIWFFLGWCGMHTLYLARKSDSTILIVTGVLQFFTFNWFLIGWACDVVLNIFYTEEANKKLLQPKKVKQDEKDPTSYPVTDAWK